MIKVSHIGIAVKNIAEAIEFYKQNLHLAVARTEEVKDQKVKTALIPVENTEIELLESTDPDGPMAKFVGKRGERIHHIAFEVNSVEETLQELKKDGIQLIDERPRIGVQGRKIAFLNPRSTGGILYELCEKSSSGGH